MIKFNLANTLSHTEDRWDQHLEMQWFSQNLGKEHKRNRDFPECLPPIALKWQNKLEERTPGCRTRHLRSNLGFISTLEKLFNYSVLVSYQQNSNVCLPHLTWRQYKSYKWPTQEVHYKTYDLFYVSIWICKLIYKHCSSTNTKKILEMNSIIYAA